ncbi:hypothetical protein FB451DRAFT_1378122 [Mycena latifolia]|nr:hypothetical protein FB451DRAFT_1378122 [Mycena latifolia]
MSQKDPKFRIAIVGSGIAGLSLAAFISRFTKEEPQRRIAVDIYEAKPEVSAIGAGVAIWKRSWQALQDLGFEKDIIKKGFNVPQDGESRGPIFRKSDQPTEGYDFHNHMMPYGPLGLHRPTLLEILQSKLSADCKIQTSKRLQKYHITEDGVVHLSFSDGSIATADVLVGADGVHSSARESMFNSLGHGYEQYIPPVFTGTVAYRGGVPKAKLAVAFPSHKALGHPRVWCGKNMVGLNLSKGPAANLLQHVVTHPIGLNIGVICFVSQPEMEGKPHAGPLAADVAIEDVRRLFANWEPDVLHLIQHVESFTAWAIHVVRPLPFYASGHVVLIGDSAHAMTPHQGVGGGQAIELLKDAHILGRLLAHPSAFKANVSAILKIHENLRLTRTQEAGNKSRINGLMYEFNHPEFLFNDPSHPDEPSSEELKRLGKSVGLSFAWLADGSIEKDWAEADAELRVLGMEPE